MISYEYFKQYYFENNRLPAGIYTPNKPLNERQLKTKYNKYVKTIEKQIIKQKEYHEKTIENQKEKYYNNYEEIKQKEYEKRKEQFIKTIEKNKYLLGNDLVPKDEKWEKVKEQVFKRDKGECQFYNKLSEVDKKYFDNYLYDKPYLKVIDCAHRLGKGANPKYKYDVNNVYCLYRYFHHCLDFYIDPYTGENITQDKVDYYWKIIAGETI